eukprot:s968_g16.t2
MAIAMRRSTEEQLYARLNYLQEQINELARGMAELHRRLDPLKTQLLQLKHEQYGSRLDKLEICAKFQLLEETMDAKLREVERAPAEQTISLLDTLED